MVTSNKKISVELEAARAHLMQQSPMSDVQWQRFTDLMEIRHFAKGELILLAGQVERYLSVVLDGLTRHFVITPEGEDKSFDFSFRHEYNSAYDSFIRQEPSRFNIEALRATTLASVPYQALEELYRRYPERNLVGRRAAEEYFIWRQERELSLLLDDAETRYRNLLEQYPHYILEVPLKHLASYLKLQPATLSRIRKKVAAGN